MLIRWLAGVPAVTALLCSANSASAQSCYDLRVQRNEANRQGERLTRDNPGITSLAVGCLAAAFAGCMATMPAMAQQASYDELADRERQLTEILTERPIQSVVENRRMCASGIAGEMDAANDRAFPGRPAYRTADQCVTYLIRAARAGRREALAGRRAPAAAALDAAFMQAYARRDAIPAGLPGMALLRPVADRCFRGTERDASLCQATGYALGSRAAHGETVRVR